MIALLADMCEHGCTTGDGIVAMAIALGAVGCLWAFGKWML